ncbi:MFS transporter [Kitasatospora sp. NPDC002227]|uniref:MFS transporter n=1 Tax=Kitasatospora sp. NPDC002227 TaxID=3154773 RepID=UPI0033195D14
MSRARNATRTGPMAVAGFRLLVVGQFASMLGDYCYAVALPWLVLGGSGGTTLLGTVLACYGIPRAVTIPLGGMLADRYGGRQVMLAADAVRAVCSAALVVTAAAGEPSLAQLAPIAAVLGASSGVFLPASYTLLPAILPAEQLGRGNALSAMANQFGGVLGPFAGGLLVAGWGPAAALAVDAVSFILSAAVLLALRPPAGAGQAEDGEAAGPAGGPSFGEVLRRGRLLHVVLVVALVCNLAFTGTMEVALPDLAHQDLGAAGYGALLTVLSVGSLIGSAVAGRARTDQRPARLFALLAVVMGIGLAGAPYAGGLLGAGVCLAVYSIASGWQNIVVITMIQTWTPAALLGRVMSMVMLAVTGSFPVSVAVAGLAVHRLGPAPFFPVAGVTIALAVTAALSQRAFREHRAGQTYGAGELTVTHSAVG